MTTVSRNDSHQYFTDSPQIEENRTTVKRIACLSTSAWIFSGRHNFRFWLSRDLPSVTRKSGLSTGFDLDRPSCYQRLRDIPSNQPGYGDVGVALSDRLISDRGATILVSGLEFKGRRS